MPPDPERSARSGRGWHQNLGVAVTGFLALDQSKSCPGWASWCEGMDKPIYGSVCLGTSYTSDGKTFTKLRSVIIDQYTVQPFDFLFYEEPIAQKKHVNVSEAAALMLVGLRATIVGVGHELRCRMVEAIKEREWRETFCGRDESGAIRREARRAKRSATDPLKAAAMERCRQLGFKPQNDNEGDALGILTHGILAKGYNPPWIANEVLRPMLGADT